MYPIDGTTPYVRNMDLLDMEMRVCVSDLGKDEHVRNRFLLFVFAIDIYGNCDDDELIMILIYISVF